MKKIIIFSFFIGMCFLTYLTTHATAFLLADDVSIEYHDIKRNLSDTEVDMRNIQHKDGHHVHEDIKIKYTFTKNNFGWDKKIDTIHIFTEYHEN